MHTMCRGYERVFYVPKLMLEILNSKAPGSCAKGSSNLGLGTWTARTAAAKVLSRILGWAIYVAGLWNLGLGRHGDSRKPLVQ